MFPRYRDINTSHTVRTYNKCSKCDRIFRLNLNGKSYNYSCRFHNIRGCRCIDCGKNTPLKPNDNDHNCYHTKFTWLAWIRKFFCC
jgi:hypothetical protein